MATMVKALVATTFPLTGHEMFVHEDALEDVPCKFAIALNQFSDVFDLLSITELHENDYIVHCAFLLKLQVQDLSFSIY